MRQSGADLEFAALEQEIVLGDVDFSQVAETIRPADSLAPA
jgi:hypothetical protein